MTAVPVPTPRHYTVDEYFDFLDHNEGRFEYDDGEIVAMAGGTVEHSRIKVDVGRVLGNAVLDGPYEPYDSDMAVAVPRYSSYVLPDLSFVCEEAAFGDEDRRRLLNPALIVEVISESSEAYDRGEKFQKYRSLESFREYMLIDSRRYAVECWYRQDEKVWRIDSAFAREESVYLHTLDMRLPLEEVYRRVKF